MKIKKLNKRVIFLAAVLVWAVFSVWYIANDQWQDFKVREIEESYEAGIQAGINKAVNTVIIEASKCTQVPLSNSEKEINVVSVECLQKNPPQQPSTQPSVQAPISQPSVEQGL